MHIESPKKSALKRTSPSKVVQWLTMQAWKKMNWRYLDYGCGYGYDVEYLAGLGYDIEGWDPFHRPGALASSYNVVILNYVLNVIQCPIRRIEALKQAWCLTENFLVVSVRTKPLEHPQWNCGDGMISRMGIFQKIFGVSELPGYIERSLGVECRSLDFETVLLEKPRTL